MTGHPFLHQAPSSLDKAAFVARYGGVYEHSPWIAEVAFDAGLAADADTAEGLADRLAAVVDAADEDKQLALLCAHPDLAGKLAVAGELTVASASEQAGAGLDRCTPDEFARFQDLNTAYRKKFGFPFIFAVAGFGRADILAAFEARVNNDRATEFKEALSQVHRIARLRLVALSKDGVS